MIDKNNGAYFWFNTFDQSSQWVDASTTGEITTQFKDFVLDGGATTSVPVSARGGATESSDIKVSNNTAEAKESKDQLADLKESSNNEDKEEKSSSSEYHGSSPKISTSSKKENRQEEKSDDKLSAQSDTKQDTAIDDLAETSSKKSQKQEKDHQDDQSELKPALNHAQTDIFPLDEKNVVDESGGDESPHDAQDDGKELMMSQSAPALVVASGPAPVELDQ